MALAYQGSGERFFSTKVASRWHLLNNLQDDLVVVPYNVHAAHRVTCLAPADTVPDGASHSVCCNLTKTRLFNDKSECEAYIVTNKSCTNQPKCLACATLVKVTLASEQIEVECLSTAAGAEETNAFVTHRGLSPPDNHCLLHDGVFGSHHANTL